MAPYEIDFTPAATSRRFMLNDAKMRVLCGPVGSGKSVTCCFEIVRRASAQAPGKDGIRRSRFAVVRQTARQLVDTTIKTFLDWFPVGVCGTYAKTIKTYNLKLGDVECEIMFRALDDADDVANLNSLELTGAWFNECRDIHPDIIDAMSKRIGRYPSKKDGGPTWYGMWGDTNPPTTDTWWYYQMEGLDPEDGVSDNKNGWAVFRQPSGRGPLAENIENLPEDYYDIQGRSEEYVRVYIDGEYGLSLAGMPVFKYFKPDYHMAKERLSPIINGIRPLVIGVDLGLTPAAVIGQLDSRGRMLVLAEAVSFDMGIQRFLRTILKPLLFERFAGANVMIIVDPAGVQRAQTDERSAVDIIRAQGFKVDKAKTNNVTARLGAVDDFLMRQVDGDSALLIDPSCTALKAALMGGYRFHKKTGAIEKNKHSHCFQAGTMVATPQGERPIESLAVGDMVSTPYGPKEIMATMSHKTAELLDITLSTGRTITCTTDHPFFTPAGVALADTLGYGSVLLSTRSGPCPRRSTRYKSSAGSGITGSRRDTTRRTILNMVRDICTAMCGKLPMGRFKRGCVSTISMGIGLITALRTSPLCLAASTRYTITLVEPLPAQVGGSPDLTRRCVRLQWLDVLWRKLMRGSENYRTLGVRGGPTERRSNGGAFAVGRYLCNTLGQANGDTVALPAKQRLESQVGSIVKVEAALSAGEISGLIDIGELELAVKVARVNYRREPNGVRVYDLTVADAHCFFAEGVLVSNCADALQYLAMHISSISEGNVMFQRKPVAYKSAVGWT